MLIVPICMANGHIIKVRNHVCGGARHAIMKATPFAAFELHFELLQSSFNLLPIGGQVLKAQLPKHVVKKYTRLWMSR
jgi:hypothetical protein